jgi:uncharacterized membrane protein YagU involved in acid resistance
MSDAIKRNNRGEFDVWKGLVAGLIAGLVASWTMNRFQDVWVKVSVNGASSDTKNREPEQPASVDHDEQDDTTVKAASVFSEGVFGHRLTKDEKKIAGSAVHYSLGTGVGGFYGAVAEVVPEVTKGAGIPFGAAFWLVVDETAVPLLGLSKGQLDIPFQRISTR